MGYPGKNRKSYDTPRHPWQAARMLAEVEVIKTYGLRNKREVWKAQRVLRKYRQIARNLLAETAKGTLAGRVKTEADEIIGRLKKYGLLKDDASLDDILALQIGNILERRLQTQVHKQGLANTVRQARQFIVHGHISVDGRKVTVPSYLVSKEQEMKIEYYPGSPISLEDHPERPAKVVALPETTRAEE
jgi:small subunit ribosomal protein S4